MSSIVKVSIQFFTVTLFLFFVSTSLYAQELSSEQVKQARVVIKALQKNKNYADADEMIKELIKQQPDNPLFYLDLSLNYYYSGQPIKAEKALQYLMENKNIETAPDQVQQNISVFYKKIHQAAEAHREKNYNKSSYNKSSNNKSKFNYSVTISTNFNDNANLFPSDVDAQQTEVQNGNEFFATYNLDPSLFGYDTQTNKSVTTATNVSLNYYSKYKAVSSQYLQLGHFLKFSGQSTSQTDEQTNKGISFSYKFQPKLKSVNQTSLISTQQYPVSFTYLTETTNSLAILSFEPSVNVFKAHRFGYRFNFNQRFYQQSNLRQLTQTPDTYEYYIDDIQDEIVSHAVYYQFNKQFEFKFNPVIYNKLSFGVVSNASEYTHFGNLLNIEINITNNLAISEQYQYKYLSYTDDTRIDMEHAFISAIEYDLLKKLKIESQYQFKMRDSNETEDKYNQSQYTIILKWID
ncbi:tetratricopeptide repeat protein [Marinicellulosiphila megalodicopiae]|uniref:tetratricopeptide repeat protein n=1 Tax=Marinicellulosiphila megalodicopiae TaxID=2724896 RepID=UPI003BB15942